MVGEDLEGDVALELDCYRHRYLAQPDAPAQDTSQGAGAALVVQEVEDQTVLARRAIQLQAKRVGGRSGSQF